MDCVKGEATPPPAPDKALPDKTKPLSPWQRRLQELHEFLPQKLHQANQYAVDQLHTTHSANGDAEDMMNLLRFALLGISVGLADAFNGGVGELSTIIRNNEFLFNFLEGYLGGGNYLSGLLLPSKRLLPFYNWTTELSPIAKLFGNEEVLRTAYFSTVAHILAVLRCLFSVIKALSHCGEKEDANRMVIYNDISEASCWAGVLNASDVKFLLIAILASIEGDWNQVNEQLARAMKQKSVPPPPVVAKIHQVVSVLLGKMDASEKYQSFLMSRSMWLSQKSTAAPGPRWAGGGEAVQAETMSSVGDILELADLLFVAKKYNEADAYLRRCEDLLTASKRARVQRFNVRNCRAELLFQRARLFHVRGDQSRAMKIYEACLSYCSNHTGALYQLSRLKPTVPMRSLHALHDLAPNAADHLVKIAKLRCLVNATTLSQVRLQPESASESAAAGTLPVKQEESGASAAPTQQTVVEEIAGYESSDLEMLRLKAEALEKLTDAGAAPYAVSAGHAAEAIFDLFLTAVSLDVRTPQLKSLLEHFHHRGEAAQCEAAQCEAASGQEGESEAGRGARDECGGNEGSGHPSSADDELDALFGNNGEEDAERSGMLSNLKPDELVYIVLKLRMSPFDWVIKLGKLLTAGCREKHEVCVCVSVWNAIRRYAKSKAATDILLTADVGTLTALYNHAAYREVHSRLKRILAVNPALSHSKELVVLRILNHISKGELPIARQISERALNYAEAQINTNSGRNFEDWNNYSIYLDFFVITRTGSHGNPLKCKTKQVLESIFKRDSNRRREDPTAEAMPDVFRSRVLTLISWIILLQAEKLRKLEKRNPALGTGSKGKFSDAQKRAMEALTCNPENWRAAYVVAVACKGLKQHANAAKIFTLCGEHVMSSDNVGCRSKEWLDITLMCETAYSLAAVRPAPVANQGKLIRATQTIISRLTPEAVVEFLTKLANSVKEFKLADIVFGVMRKFYANNPATITTSYVHAMAQVGTLACLERARQTQDIKNPNFLGTLINDCELVAALLEKVLDEKKKTDANDQFPQGSHALACLVLRDRPVVGPLFDYDNDGNSDLHQASLMAATAVPRGDASQESERSPRRSFGKDEVMKTSVITTKDMLDELPRSESLKKKLDVEVLALIQRLKELQPLVNHEYRTAEAVREERLKDNEKILQQVLPPVNDEPIIFGLGSAT